MASGFQQPTSFEWDDDNEAAHVACHGIPFGIAAAVFDDPGRLEIEDLRNQYGERRWNTIGVVDGLCINVTFTIRPQAVARLISARAAHRKERKAYGYGS